MSEAKFKKRARAIIMANITNIRRPHRDAVTIKFTDDIAQALEDVRRETIEECADLTENIGSNYSSVGLFEEAKGVLLALIHICALKQPRHKILTK